jgi:hypothetical protein
MKIKRWMRAELDLGIEDYLDSASVINATKLAEEAYDYFVGDDETPTDEYFDAAVEVVAEYTKEKGYNE